MIIFYKLFLTLCLILRLIYLISQSVIPGLSQSHMSQSQSYSQAYESHFTAMHVCNSRDHTQPEAIGVPVSPTQCWLIMPPVFTAKLGYSHQVACQVRERSAALI